MNATNETIPPAVRQLMVEAAAELEDLTDEGGYEADAVRRLAGRLRDAAAGRPLTKSWDVYIDTGVNVDMPADVDPSTDEGVAAIKAAATGKLLAAIEDGSFDIRCEFVGE